MHECHHIGCKRKYKTEIGLKKHNESEIHKQLVIIDKPKIVPNKVNDKPKITAIYKCPHDGHAIDMSNSSSSDEEEDDSWSMTISI
jgi:hypothetical protein